MKYGGTTKATATTYCTLEQELHRVHSSFYTYDNAVFVNARTPMAITCLVHGDFMQRSRDHKRGKGCEKCYRARQGKSRKKSQDLVTKELNSVIGNRFTILPFVYTNAHMRIDVVCKTCGTSNSIKVCSAISGKNGCKHCFAVSSSWSKRRYENKTACLYYIRINDAYKIGLTKTSVQKRYRTEIAAGFDIEVLHEIQYADGVEAFKEEKRILQKYAAYRYKGNKMLLSGGDSELFAIDIRSLGGVTSML